jgi:transposase InsO family protein/ribonuclease HI
MRGKVAEELDKMQEMGCIRESNTPWLSPLVMVKKKTGDLRPCIDLRKLNAITIPDYYPLPRVHDALDKIGGSHYFTCLDLSKGFWQLPLDDNASWKCGIISNDKVYQCLTMPFGLRNAPSAFMRAMRTILGPIWEKCVVYIDDIVVITKEDSFEQHLRDIEDVLERFKLFNMKVNPKKCEFVRKEISFLGHRVTKDGYRPDERNTVKIQELPTPKSQADVRHCLGVFSFFRRLIEGFANIAAPLTALCGKGTKFAWSDDSQKAFDTLKEKLVVGPLVEFPDDSQELHIHVDASTKGIGCALTQRKKGETVGRPICFYSRALSKAEQKKPAVQLELMAIVEALRWCRYYTYGKKVVVHTDHRPLIHLMQKRTTHTNLTRWLIELQQYDNVEIEYLDGKKNTLADALSRWEALTDGHPVTELEDMVHGPFGLDTDGEVRNTAIQGEKCQVTHDMCNIKSIQELQAEDTLLSKAIQAIREKTDPTTIKDTELRWYVEKCELNSNDTLVLKPQRPGEDGYKLIVPQTWRRKIFDQFHGSEIGGGHMNARSTQGKMKDYAWRGMPRDVAEWHKRCYRCQIRAPKRRKVPPIMTRLQRPFEKMGIDCCGPLMLTEDGNNHYVLFIDEFTKYVVTVAIPDTTSLTVVRALWDHVILKFGCPQEIVTDNGKTFTAKLFKEVLHRLGIKGSYSTPHHSDGNAIAERTFRTYHDMIAKYVEGMHPKDGAIPWDRMLPIATFAYNVTRHSTTGETPFMMMHGRDPIFPIHLALHEKEVEKRVPMSIKEFRAELTKLVETVYQNALEAFEEAITKIKAKADKHAVESDIAEGEVVLYQDYDLRVGMSNKFKSPWKDVHRVRRLENQHAWITPITGPNDKLKRVHLNQIKRFYPEHEPTEAPTGPQEDLTEAKTNRGEKAKESTGDQKGQEPREKRRVRKEQRTQEIEKRTEMNKQRRRGEGSKYELRQNIKRRETAQG